MLLLCEFCITKKKPIQKHKHSPLKQYGILTADHDAEQNTNDKVPGRHRNNDADDRDILHSKTCLLATGYHIDGQELTC